MITRCLLMVVVVHACRAATGISSVTEHPDHPNKCWVEERKKAFDIGEQWQSKDCMAYMCVRHKAGLHIEWTTCGKLSNNDPSCTMKEDLTLDYPFCCPQPVCSRGRT